MNINFSHSFNHSSVDNNSVTINFVEINPNDLQFSDDESGEDVDKCKHAYIHIY